MRAKVVELSTTLARVDWPDGTSTEYYVSGAKRPYVRIMPHDGLARGPGPQVCKGLRTRGLTLTVEPGETLVGVIRRELKKGAQEC